jgi:CRP-like cAMP-binding protein
VAHPDGEAIFTQDAPGDEMYVIQEGQVEILLRADDGSEVGLATLGRGDFFGEMAVIDGTPRTATARSKGGCKVLPLRGELFTEMLQHDPETTLRIMRKLSARIRQLQSRVAELAVDRPSFVSEAPPVPPAPVSTPASQRIRVRLLHGSGLAIELPPIAEVRVGRPDLSIGSVPEVDLTQLSEGRTVSRSHARLLQRDGKLLLVAETGAVNGTFLNHERLELGVPSEVRNGDTVTFGKVAFAVEIR